MKVKDFKPCAMCGEGMMHTGLPLFWRVSIQRMGLDGVAVRQVHGLETMMGSVALARVMGPDPDIAKSIGEREVLICESCASQQTSIYELGLSEKEQGHD